MVEVKAEVTGSVWQIVAEVGSALTAGAEIAILESMKMEIPVTTPVAGTLKEIRVEVGQPVKAGDTIAVVEES